MTESSLFPDAMALRPLGDGAYAGELNKIWTIGPKLHGGAMLSLCAAAAREALGSDKQPISVSANYLSAGSPGDLRLETFVRKQGRRISVVDVELIGGARVAVHAVVTLGEPEHLVPPLLSANPVVSKMSPEPPPDVEPIGPGHPMFGTVNYWEGVDVRPLMSTVPDGPSPDAADARSTKSTSPPVIQIWARPRGMAPDILFALMCGDVSMPVAFAVGRRGWAPTVQLTAYLRGLPADGWLRVMATTTQIGQDWFDEDHIVIDSQGRIIVQTRQLALVPDH
jgi:Acyl-CoA thioesterase C-terminal domain/Acyl-CoA thioesterase N-terminal domain